MKKTNKYQPAAHLLVGFITVVLAAFFYVVQNRHFGFYWLAIMPPIAYCLLGRKSAKILLSLFGGYMVFFILSNKSNWSPAEFDIYSILNIFAVTVCIALMISSIVKTRNEAWDALKKTSLQVENQQSELRLILDSAGEAIYGVDSQGRCTFCNRSCIEMLGYRDQTELLGKLMHKQIHHAHKDGTVFPESECKIYKAFIKGESSHVDDEVFWRADNTCFDVEYFSYPKIKDGKIMGAVITFMDISERKQKEEEIRYLSSYDVLTGLYNRRCFEENRAKIDIPGNLPISVIFADINGLKMINDIFGHTSGDELIKKSADILQQACRQNDVIARVGGDEFIILLPKTAPQDAQKVVDRIKAGFVQAKVEAIKCSISLGLGTKDVQDELLSDIVSDAEHQMYKDKTMNRKSINKDIITTIVETLHSRDPREKAYSINVRDLCVVVGLALHLTENEITRLKWAGYLHNIGKIVTDANARPDNSMHYENPEEIQQYALVGYRILNLFDDTLDLAEYVYAQHERWDGAGYPRGLTGDQIPLISRIVAIARIYEHVLDRGTLPLPYRKQAALQVIDERAGSQFEPMLAKLFVNVINKENDN